MRLCGIYRKRLAQTFALEVVHFKGLTAGHKGLQCKKKQTDFPEHRDMLFAVRCFVDEVEEGVNDGFLGVALLVA